MAESQQVQDILASLADPVVFLEMLTELNGVPTKLEPYQVNFLRDRSDFRLVNKSRQIGFSTIIGAEAFVNMMTRQSYKANVVSINQTEASDKVEMPAGALISLTSGWL